MGLLQRILRAGEGKKLKLLESIVPDVNRLEPEIERLSDDELARRTVEFRERVANGADLDDLLEEAFAVVREAGRRVLGQRHFDAQLMGGAALHFGWVAEMKTGEGKTLVSTLPAYLNALGGKGVHLVTVNDYLAKRDAAWMGRIHQFLGLEVGIVVPEIDDPVAKRRAYAADITYGTNNELGFDYLRDNMAPTKGQMAQRGHNFAIVDEVDSILIDEARTPLIISGRVDDAAQLYLQFAQIVRGLSRERDYEVDEAKRTVVPTEEGIGRVEQALGVENLYDNINQNYVHQLQAALKAKELFKRDVDYIIQHGEAKIVDEFTGRILEGRRWSEGLHQAVEAKEGVRIKEENQTLATVTLQNYFRLYEKLSGMTGTAATEAGEFAHTYGLEVVSIPTNRPMVRADHPDVIYRTEEAKFAAAVDDIAERHTLGQPVLVGTVSVEKSELLSRLLDKRGIPHFVLNAKQHEQEAVVVTQAGQLAGVTVATNMAGRGVDILLGGNPEGLARRELEKEGLTPEAEPDRFAELVARFSTECAHEGQKVRELGGLYVLGTERHESRRIDNQLRGRSGRQGDPGASRFYLSLEDDLMRLFATGAMNWVMSRGGMPEDMPLEAKMVTKAIERAQRTVEDRNFEIRKVVLKYDEVMNQQRTIIYGRRQQILEGRDLRAESLAAIERAIHRVITAHCDADDPDAWDLGELHRVLLSYFPTAINPEVLRGMVLRDEIAETLCAEATAQYEAKEAALGAEALRDIERRVMLAVIDQRWREHLYEMDYLQEGINLRAMGQRDPLVEWQTEGYDMFEAMMALIEEDFVRYVFHLEVVHEEEPRPVARNLQYSAPEDPVQGSAALREMAAHEPSTAGEAGGEADGPPQAPGSLPGPLGFPHASRAREGFEKQAPVRVEKVPGRNDPCSCGSGKKYKLCHGR